MTTKHQWGEYCAPKGKNMTTKTRNKKGTFDVSTLSEADKIELAKALGITYTVAKAGEPVFSVWKGRKTYFLWNAWNEEDGQVDKRGIMIPFHAINQIYDDKFADKFIAYVNKYIEDHPEENF